MAPMTSRVRHSERLLYYVPTVMLFVAVLVGWEVAVHTLEIKAFILPPPTAIFQAFGQQGGPLLARGRYTATEALGGLLIGCSAGLLVALIMVRWTTTREVLLPWAIAANSVPIIAFAPIMNNWFGVTTQLSKMMIVAVITCFPMMINMLRGLTEVDPWALELLRSYAASEWHVLLKLRLPHALPSLFSALKVCSTLSLIGAVVGEFFGGPYQALGVYILQEAAWFRFANAWAAIMIAMALGMIFYLVILGVERLVIPWHTAVRDVAA
jgi:NitT/TauT family transport system permease protein